MNRVASFLADMVVALAITVIATAAIATMAYVVIRPFLPLFNLW